MYRNDNRIILDKSGSVEDAQNKIKTLVKDLHLTICKINRINKGRTFLNSNFLVSEFL